MKIGILTIHRIYNHGSFLQAFAVKSIVEGLRPGGIECQFIDWPLKDSDAVQNFGQLPKSLRSPHSLTFLIHKKLGHSIYCRDVEVAWLYNELAKKYFNQCHEYLKVDSIANYKTDYDLIIVGSDEAFNCTQDDAKWNGLFCFTLNNANIISYAASFGYSTVERLCEYKVENTVKSGLNSYKSISVRDNNSQDIIEHLTNRKSLIHLDPVFIYDYSNYIPKIKFTRKFILVYNYYNRINDPDFIVRVRKFAKEHGLKIISIFEYCPWADQNVALTSFEVLAYYINASYVITDTFHGVVLSIKFNKRFCTFVRDSNYNKLHYILERFGLTSQIIEKPESFPSILFNHIKWDMVNKEIAQERERSVTYFKETLGI